MRLLSRRFLPALGLDPPNAVETRCECAFDGRDPDHLAGFLQLGSRVTNLGQREEALIGRILVGHRVEEVRSTTAGNRVPVKFFIRHMSRRCPVSGCMSRIVRSSAMPPYLAPDGTSPDAGRDRPPLWSLGANGLRWGVRRVFTQFSGQACRP